jgi:protoheme IX farnesyltransferase
MLFEKAGVKPAGRGRWLDYVDVIKPRETALLVFISVVSALLAVNGTFSSRTLVILIAVLMASAGANGLTNYLDRRIDAQMARTARRALPSGRIFPAENALIFCLVLTSAGLVLAWFLSPWAFAADLIGTLAAVVYRKRATCVFPQGMIASCAPILMGWLAASPHLNWQTLILCVLISLWLPSHIWSVMIAHQSEYRQAGLNFFPISSNFKTVSRILLGFAVLLMLASLGLYCVSDLSWLYLAEALLSGSVMVWAAWRLALSRSSRDAWKLYKLSSFPYLGLLFLTIALDLFLKI